MRSFSGGILASVLVASLVPSVASAAPVREGVRLDVLQPASPESHFIRAESPHTPNEDAVEFAASASVEYASRPVRAAGVDSEEGEG